MNEQTTENPPTLSAVASTRLMALGINPDQLNYRAETIVRHGGAEQLAAHAQALEEAAAFLRQKHGASEARLASDFYENGKDFHDNDHDGLA